MTQRWRPQTTGNQMVDRQLSMAADVIADLTAQVQALSGVKSQTLTTDQIKALVDPRSLVQHFQADGDAPLNITGLLGITGTPQVAGVKFVNSLPLPGDPLFVSTAAVVFSGALYINNGTGFVVTSSGVTSIDADGGITGFDFTGGPITSSGTLTMVVSNAAVARGAISAAESGNNTDITDLMSGVAIGGSKINTGVGSPETVVAGNVGDVYLRQDGGAGTTLYIKESGLGSTGWVAK